MPQDVFTCIGCQQEETGKISITAESSAVNFINNELWKKYSIHQIKFDIQLNILCQSLRTKKYNHINNQNNECIKDNINDISENVNAYTISVYKKDEEGFNDKPEKLQTFRYIKKEIELNENSLDENGPDVFNIALGDGCYQAIMKLDGSKLNEDNLFEINNFYSFKGDAPGDNTYPECINIFSIKVPIVDLLDWADIRVDARRDKGTWNSKAGYKFGDLVKYNNRFYVAKKLTSSAKKDSKGEIIDNLEPPIDKDHWKLYKNTQRLNIFGDSFRNNGNNFCKFIKQISDAIIANDEYVFKVTLYNFDHATKKIEFMGEFDAENVDLTHELPEAVAEQKGFPIITLSMTIGQKIDNNILKNRYVRAKCKSKFTSDEIDENGFDLNIDKFFNNGPGSVETVASIENLSLKEIELPSLNNNYMIYSKWFNACEFTDNEKDAQSLNDATLQAKNDLITSFKIITCMPNIGISNAQEFSLKPEPDNDQIYTYYVDAVYDIGYCTDVGDNPLVCEVELNNNTGEGFPVIYNKTIENNQAFENCNVGDEDPTVIENFANKYVLWDTSRIRLYDYEQQQVDALTGNKEKTELSEQYRKLRTRTIRIPYKLIVKSNNPSKPQEIIKKFEDVSVTLPCVLKELENSNTFCGDYIQNGIVGDPEILFDNPLENATPSDLAFKIKKSINECLNDERNYRKAIRSLYSQSKLDSQDRETYGDGNYRFEFYDDIENNKILCGSTQYTKKEYDKEKDETKPCFLRLKDAIEKLDLAHKEFKQAYIEPLKAFRETIFSLDRFVEEGIAKYEVKTNLMRNRMCEVGDFGLPNSSSYTYRRIYGVTTKKNHAVYNVRVGRNIDPNMTFTSVVYNNNDKSFIMKDNNLSDEMHIHNIIVILESFINKPDKNNIPKINKNIGEFNKLANGKISVNLIPNNIELDYDGIISKYKNILNEPNHPEIRSSCGTGKYGTGPRPK